MPTARSLILAASAASSGSTARQHVAALGPNTIDRLYGHLNLDVLPVDIVLNQPSLVVDVVSNDPVEVDVQTTEIILNIEVDA